MSGMFTVVGNPRGRRRKARKARKARRRSSTRRRRVARTPNPAPRRRRRSGRRRRAVSRRRRRTTNPRLFGGAMGLGTFVKGLTGAGVGAIGARLAANAVKNQFFPTASPVMKIAIEAGVATVGAYLVGSVLKQRALAAGLAAGGAVIVALDIYDAFIKPSLPAILQDYQTGTLSDWAPQGQLGAYERGSLSGGNVYDDDVYS